MTYTLITWLDATSHPERREGIPYELAYALATRGGYAKAQIVISWDVIELEVRS